jgi:ribosomal protein L29
MSSFEELNAEIAALKQELGANKVKVDAGTLSEAREVAIRQQITTDTTRLTALEERREFRLQQQQPAGE